VSALNDLRDLLNSMSDLGAIRQEPIKLTERQLDLVKAHSSFPVRPPDPFGGVLGDYAGVPIVLVEDEADSSPHVENWGGPLGPVRG
jgi:hypothetical protein